MPKKNGHEVLAEIQQQTALQHVPLIVFSSSSRREDREKALALGAKNYFEKSIDLTSFVTVARQVIAYSPREVSLRPAAPRRWRLNLDNESVATTRRSHVTDRTDDVDNTCDCHSDPALTIKLY